MMNGDVNFLYFIPVVMVAAWVARRLLFRRCDRTLYLPVPPIPANPDPYEVAYLANGSDMVAEVMIVSLTQRGYLRSGCGSILTASNYAGKDLSPAESELIHWFAEPREGYAVFWSGTPKRLMKPHFYGYHKNLQGAGLLIPQAVKDTGNVLWIVSSAVIALLALFATCPGLGNLDTEVGN